MNQTNQDMYRDERFPTLDIDSDLEMEYQMSRWYK